jgi:predicted nuclease with TOPRIM domain
VAQDLSFSITDGANYLREDAARNARREARVAIKLAADSRRMMPKLWSGPVPPGEPHLSVLLLQPEVAQVTLRYGFRELGAVAESWRGLEKAIRELLDAYLSDRTRSVASEAQVIRRVEEFADTTFAQLEQENSELRLQLRDARIEVETLQRQLQMVMEALATGKRGIVSASLRLVGATLLAVISGASGGVAQGATTPVPEAPAIEASAAAELHVECNNIVLDLEGLGD